VSWLVESCDSPSASILAKLTEQGADYARGQLGTNAPTDDIAACIGIRPPTDRPWIANRIARNWLALLTSDRPCAGPLQSALAVLDL
jgi:hypothetical protein